MGEIIDIAAADSAGSLFIFPSICQTEQFLSLMGFVARLLRKPKSRRQGRTVPKVQDTSPKLGPQTLTEGSDISRRPTISRVCQGFSADRWRWNMYNKKPSPRAKNDKKHIYSVATARIMKVHRIHHTG